MIIAFSKYDLCSDTSYIDQIIADLASNGYQVINLHKEVDFLRLKL